MNQHANRPVILKPSWSDYARLVERLRDRIVSAGYRPDQVIGIASGGLMPALILAKCFRCPLAVMAAQSYGYSGSGLQDSRGEVRVGCNLAVVDSDLAGRLLLVDDLTESGSTLRYCADWLKAHYGAAVQELRSAVIYHKRTSVYQPDFMADCLPKGPDGTCPWVEQPWEV